MAAAETLVTISTELGQSEEDATKTIVIESTPPSSDDDEDWEGPVVRAQVARTPSHVAQTPSHVAKKADSTTVPEPLDDLFDTDSDPDMTSCRRGELPPSTITQEAGGVLESAVSDVCAGLFPIKNAKELEKPLEEEGITLPHVTMTKATLKELKKLKRKEDKKKFDDVATKYEEYRDEYFDSLEQQSGDYTNPHL